jgi:DNA mismatch endonuclease (patch repair protein)
VADKLTVEERSMLMSKIKNKGTSIEVLVRKRLFNMGFRYRLNVSSLPGKPDIVLKKYNSVIFVNGCYWHGHDCKDGHLPKSNIEFWKDKIDKNIERDKLNCKLLQDTGWNVIIIWECELIELDSAIKKVVDKLISQKASISHTETE